MTAEHVHDMLGLKMYTGPLAGCPYYPCGNEQSLPPAPQSDAEAKEFQDENTRLRANNEELVAALAGRNAAVEALNKGNEAWRVTCAKVNADVAQPEEALGHWQSVFRDHFGPEGGDLMIADKGVQDLVAELNMACADVERLERELQAVLEVDAALRGERDAASLRELALLEVLTGIQDYCGYHFREFELGYAPLNTAKWAIAANEAARAAPGEAAK